MTIETGNFPGIARSGLINLRIALMILLAISGCYTAGAIALDPGAEFNHNETNFPLDFKHALSSCESCHVQGVFTGTPKKCAACHSNAGRIKASAPSSLHIRVVGDCDFCHTPALWTQVVRVDHSVVVGSCGSCHNGVIAEGKNPGHVSSGSLCEDCHTTFNWRFNHFNTTSNCILCHNGVIAEGKNPGHILSTVSCEDCHDTFNWTQQDRVDHGSVLGTCFSCHNGVIARGKNALHIPSSNDCSLCHSVLGWTPATP